MSEMSTKDYDAFYALLGHQQTGGLTPVVALIPKNDWYIPKRAYIRSGGELEKFAKKYNGTAQCYIGLNPVKQDIDPDADHKDEDVTHICNIIIDVDPEKSDPTISDVKKYAATDSEKDRAVKDADVIEAWLKENGFTFYRDDSGNGNRFILNIKPIALIDDNRPKIKELLKALQYHIQEDTGIKIDTSVHDPRRITGIPGTLNLKRETETRKNRMRIPALPIPDRTEDPKFREFIFSLGKETKPEPEQDCEDLPEGLTRSPDLTDEKVISLLMGSRLANSFEDLYDGVLSEYGNDASDGDYHLCRHIAFYTQNNDQIERIARGSDLVRDKWDRPDGYFRKTISNAIKSLKSTYQPKNGTCRETTPNENTEEDIETLTFDEIRNLKEEQLDIRLNMDLPDDHFLTVFRKWQESRTDAYSEYHFMGGLWLLSAFCQGKVVLKLTTGHVKPNIWVTILGLTTISHKTTSINNTKYIFETVTETRAYNNSYSQEGYLETLQDNPVSHFIYDEVAGLLAKMHAKYNDGIFDLDCALYSGSSIQKTLASKKGQPHTVTVDNPYVTKLYATTPDKFTTNIQQVDFDCGWGFRFLYCWPKYKKGRRGLATETQEDVDARSAVITRALKIYQMIEQYKEVPFTVEPGALEYLDAIVEQHENIAWNTDNDAYAAATGRGQENTLKIAMLLEIGKSKPSFCITLDTMKYAADLVFNYFVPTTLDVCDRIQEDIRNNQIEKIISILRKKGGIGYHSDILNKSRIVAKVFNECIYTMVESGAIKVYKEKETGKKTYVLLGGGNSEKHNSHNSQNSQILQLPHVEKSNENFVNLITSDTIRTPTEYFGFLCESVNCENSENFENSNGTKKIQSFCEDNKPEEQCSEILQNVENLENVNADLIESCLDQWEKFGGPIFSKNAHKAKLDIVKYHKVHGINPTLISDAVDRRAKGRCLDCGSENAPNFSKDEGNRCKACYDKRFMRRAPAIPSEFNLQDPAEVTP